MSIESEQTLSRLAKQISEMTVWQGPVSPTPVSGGITNRNFIVEDDVAKYFVRIGTDIPVHQIMRFNELAASEAAHAAGISPRVHFAADGVMVLEHISGLTLGEEDVRADSRRTRIIDLVRRCHQEVPRHWRGAALVFWVFQVIRGYATTLVEGDSRLVSELPYYLKLAEQLETSVGPIKLVFGHNDLLPANIIDDGDRLWLIDYDYAGFNSPLFDLGGLASNNEFSAIQETEMLEHYCAKPLTDELVRRYYAMKCASLLRESMWSMVSELHSDLDIDYVAYTAENLSRFEATLQTYREL